MVKDKILVVSPIPPPYSGPEVMTAQLLNSPLRKKYELLHYNISKNREVSKKARFDLKNVLYGIIQPVKLSWLMAKHKPDLVYTNLAQNWGGFLRYATFILTVALFRKPIIVRVMGDGLNYFYERSNKALQKFIRIILNKIDRFIVRANVLKDQFCGLIPSDKLDVVYSGIDVSAFYKYKMPKQNKVLRVLFVGYLTRAKGALDLLQAIPEVIREYPNVVFQLMGAKIDLERNIKYINNPKSNEAELQSLLAKHEISRYVELLGIQWGEEKIKTFVNADIFLLPSYSEAFPTVVLEAMAAGLPVIATPVGALPEAFTNENILFVEPGNVAQLAKSILYLLRDPSLRRQMGMQNQQIVQRNFGLDAYADRVENVIITSIQNS